MGNIIIMYHYIRDNTNFKAFSTDEFRRQVEYVMGKYRIISINELIEKKPKDNTCVLTFDDGLKDGFTNVLPIIEELGVKGTFFIPTKILKSKLVIEAQKRHLLLAKLGTEKFVQEFNSLVDEIFQVRKEGQKNNYEDELTSNLKYVLDNMDQDVSKKILNKIFSEYFDEEEEFSKIYLNKKEIDIMLSKGMEICSHGHGHFWLGNLYFKDMVADLTKTVEVFTGIFGKHPSFLSYPFGSFNLFTKRVAKKLGFKACVTVVKGKNTDLKDPFELSRYDCIDLFPRTNRYGL